MRGSGRWWSGSAVGAISCDGAAAVCAGEVPIRHCDGGLAGVSTLGKELFHVAVDRVGSGRSAGRCNRRTDLGGELGGSLEGAIDDLAEAICIGMGVETVHAERDFVILDGRVDRVRLGDHPVLEVVDRPALAVHDGLAGYKDRIAILILDVVLTVVLDSHRAAAGDDGRGDDSRDEHDLIHLFFSFS